MKIGEEAEAFVPREVEDMASSYGVDTKDPDLFGDWDRYQ